MLPINSSLRTKEGEYLQPPTCRKGRSLSGSRTEESKRRKSSINWRPPVNNGRITFGKWAGSDVWNSSILPPNHQVISRSSEYGSKKRLIGGRVREKYCNVIILWRPGLTSWWRLNSAKATCGIVVNTPKIKNKRKKRKKEKWISMKHNMNFDCKERHVAF